MIPGLPGSQINLQGAVIQTSVVNKIVLQGQPLLSQVQLQPAGPTVLSLGPHSQPGPASTAHTLQQQTTPSLGLQAPPNVSVMNLNLLRQSQPQLVLQPAPPSAASQNVLIQQAGGGVVNKSAVAGGVAGRQQVVLQPAVSTPGAMAAGSVTGQQQVVIQSSAANVLLQQQQQLAQSAPGGQQQKVVLQQASVLPGQQNVLLQQSSQAGGGVLLQSPQPNVILRTNMVQLQSAPTTLASLPQGQVVVGQPVRHPAVDTVNTQGQVVLSPTVRPISNPVSSSQTVLTSLPAASSAGNTRITPQLHLQPSVGSSASHAASPQAAKVAPVGGISPATVRVPGPPVKGNIADAKLPSGTSHILTIGGQRVTLSTEQVQQLQTLIAQQQQQKGQDSTPVSTTAQSAAPSASLQLQVLQQRVQQQQQQQQLSMTGSVVSQHDHSLPLLQAGSAPTPPVRASVPGMLHPASTSVPSVLQPARTNAPTVLHQTSVSVPTVVQPMSTGAPTMLQPVSTSVPTILQTVSTSVPTMLQTVSTSVPTMLQTVSTSVPTMLQTVSTSVSSVLPLPTGTGSPSTSQGAVPRILPSSLTASHVVAPNVDIQKLGLSQDLPFHVSSAARIPRLAGIPARPAAVKSSVHPPVVSVSSTIPNVGTAVSSVATQNYISTATLHTPQPAVSSNGSAMLQAAASSSGTGSMPQSATSSSGSLPVHPANVTAAGTMKSGQSVPVKVPLQQVFAKVEQQIKLLLANKNRSEQDNTSLRRLATIQKRILEDLQRQRNSCHNGSTVTDSSLPLLLSQDPRVGPGISALPQHNGHAASAQGSKTHGKIHY